eukprot:scaffold47189_cov73-Phaeocystis_antarctica.AAC.1
MQLVELSSGWNFPGSHNSHAPMFRRCANVPGLQGVGPIRVRALAARQWRRRALRAVRARHAHVALGPAGLVHKLARDALVACWPLGVKLHGTRAARRLLGAARWREVARGGLCALTAAGEVGGVGVRAFFARQHRAGTLGAERAGLAGNARLLALVGLVRTGCAPVTRALACDGLDGAGATLGLLRAACRCVKARGSRRALLGAAEVGPIRVRTLAAWQWRRRALRAVRARHAHVALGPADLVHKLACAALVARGPFVKWLHGTRAARCRIGAASWRVGSWRYIFATSRITQAGEIAPRATGARYTPHAPRLAVVALLACGRSDSARCSAHVAGQAEGGAQTAGLRQGIVAVAVHPSCARTRVVLIVPALPESNTMICCREAVPKQIDIVRQRCGQDVAQLATSSDVDRVEHACGIVAMQERFFTQHDAATQLHPQRPAPRLLGSDATLEGAAAEDSRTTRDPGGTTTRGLAALEHRVFHIQRPPPHLQRPSKLSAALPKRAVLHIQSPAVHVDLAAQL